MVYGSAELEPAVRAAIEFGPHAALLKSRVALAGFVPHDAIDLYYEAADVFVQGSRREGSGYAALEALACGVVPVLTDIPSFRWLTDDGRVGALWRAGDPASLAGALANVASQPITGMRTAARELFDRRFSWGAIGRRATAIYRERCRT
jgi:glycosyltransferase involved in cell wall biosynthesis